MIEAVTASTLSEVLPLVRAYQEFYKVADISDSRNAEFFSQFGEDNPFGCLFLYRESRSAGAGVSAAGQTVAGESREPGAGSLSGTAADGSEKSGPAIGFATVYFSFSSAAAKKVGILNDLYVVSSARGQGVGRALIEHCRGFALSRGAARLQWVTAPDNTHAQALYESLPTRKSTWVHYTY